MRPLPIGIQTFSKIIEGNYIYIDKTRQILDLINSGGYLFLSRPRRFGKSLLVSTLKELFSGNQELFQGLFIYDKIPWTPHPVIHLDLSAISSNDDDILRRALLGFVDRTAEEFGVTLSAEFLKERFLELLRKISEQAGHGAVVLVDEYDKPIIDFLETPEKALKNREVLREFFGVLKTADPYLRFVFLTGVSKFSKVSVFSGLNNLMDMTLASQCATLLGYTQSELEGSFEDYLTPLASEIGVTRTRLLEKIRRWYNGYSWDARTTVYNPFSILGLFTQRHFSTYWFASGTPTFLIQKITGNQLEATDFENKTLYESQFDAYDIENLNVFTLMFQTGYLTLSAIERAKTPRRFTLNFPNIEVKDAFLTHLLTEFTNHRSDEIPIAIEELSCALKDEKPDRFLDIIRALFAKIPYPLHIQQEAYYHSLFYMILALMGVNIDLEVLTDKGRIDGVLEFDDKVYVIEMKYSRDSGETEALLAKAITQIRQKKYTERFLRGKRTCLLLGVAVADKEIDYRLENLSELT